MPEVLWYSSPYSLLSCLAVTNLVSRDAMFMASRPPPGALQAGSHDVTPAWKFKAIGGAILSHRLPTSLLAHHDALLAGNA